MSFISFKQLYYQQELVIIQLPKLTVSRATKKTVPCMYNDSCCQVNMLSEGHLRVCMRVCTCACMCVYVCAFVHVYLCAYISPGYDVKLHPVVWSLDVGE